VSPYSICDLSHYLFNYRQLQTANVHLQEFDTIHRSDEQC
jgi:hypothetical protein